MTVVTVASLDHYTRDEADDLYKAITLSCSCGPVTKCGSHQMLKDDQRTLDHLLFVRRMRQGFIDAEHVL